MNPTHSMKTGNRISNIEYQPGDGDEHGGQGLVYVAAAIQPNREIFDQSWRPDDFEKINK